MVSIVLLIGILTGCEGSNDVPDRTSSPDTGSISFNVTWNQDLDGETDYQTKAVVCGDGPDQVATVRAAIVQTEKDVHMFGGPWDCMPPSGIIQNVPVGTGYVLLFYGHNGSGQTTYSGAEVGISVTTGNNDIAIDANQFFTEIETPENESPNIDPDGTIVFSWTYASGAAGYQLWISESLNLSDPLIFDTDGLYYPLSAGSLNANTTYYWTVFPIDIYNNRSYFYWKIYEFTTASGGVVADDNYEENDSIDAAVDLPRGVDLSSIDGPGIAVFPNLDYYKIVVPYTSANLVIGCYFTHASGDIDIELYDADDNFLDGSWTNSDNEYIYHAHTGGPATYYVLVYLFDEEFGPSNTYDLRWTAQ